MIKLKNYRTDYLTKSSGEYEALKKFGDSLRAKRNGLFNKLGLDSLIVKLEN